jgi:hypothetical protein
MTSSIPMSRWDVEAYLPAAVLDEITDIRIEHPRWVIKEARRRRRRKTLAPDGRLVLAAVDHPARGVNEIRGDALAMGDRQQYLARARRVLDDPALDGIMATPDVLEELLILSHLERKKKGKGFLDGRVIVGQHEPRRAGRHRVRDGRHVHSMSAARIAELGFDGGKMMYRLDPQDPASGRTIQACAQALNDLRAHGLPGFLEPLGVVKQPKGYTPAKDAETLVRQCGIAGRPRRVVPPPLAEGPDRGRPRRGLPRDDAAAASPGRARAGHGRETLRDFATALAAGSAHPRRHHRPQPPLSGRRRSHAALARADRARARGPRWKTRSRSCPERPSPSQVRRRARAEEPLADALDVCVLGRVGYDLYAVEQGRPLAEVEHFSRHLGGSSANIAVGLARLGPPRGHHLQRRGRRARRLPDRVPRQGARRTRRRVTRVAGYGTSLCLTEVSPPDRFPRSSIATSPRTARCRWGRRSWPSSAAPACS